MKSNWCRRLYEWAWGAGERCYVGKMRTKPYWKRHCRKVTRLKQQERMIGCLTYDKIEGKMNPEPKGIK